MNADAHLTCNDRRVARVLRYLAEDLTRRPTLSDVSRLAGLETTYFSKLFRVIVGVPYAEWSGRLRVRHARQLLEIADLSITAVAAAVGYMDVTTFERAFRRVEGTSPREYRRTLQRDRASNARNAEVIPRNVETTGRHTPHTPERWPIGATLPQE
jgi:transcriptional regulator GlxA family with amidase domain